MRDGWPIDLEASKLPGRLLLPRWSREAGRSPLDVVIRPPGSKSITNRALLLAGLCKGESVLRHALVEADDAKRMLAAIKVLGAKVDDSQEGILRVVGTGGRWKTDGGVGGDQPVIDLHNAGTATRFLSASALLADSAITITGNERMQQRPIGELVGLLEALGARVEYLGNEGYPPMRIGCEGKLKTNQVVIGATQSSQFISALMLVAVFLDDGLILSMPEGATSASYVWMTLALLEYLGATVQSAQDLSVVRISKGLNAFDLEIEADASGATYWWAAGALLAKATVRVDGVPMDRSLQGDAGFGELLTRMGCRLVERDGTLACKGPAQLNPIMCDMSDMPDAVMSLGAVACFASGTTVIKGVRTLRVKECDRIEAMKVEFGKIGVVVEDRINGDDDVLSITPPAGGVRVDDDCEAVMFDTYDDHRMAMSLSLIALRRANVTINDPRCVDKTYPRFFEDFARLYS